MGTCGRARAARLVPRRPTFSGAGGAKRDTHRRLCPSPSCVRLRGGPSCEPLLSPPPFREMALPPPPSPPNEKGPGTDLDQHPQSIDITLGHPLSCPVACASLDPPPHRKGRVPNVAAWAFPTEARHAMERRCRFGGHIRMAPSETRRSTWPCAVASGGPAPQEQHLALPASAALAPGTSTSAPNPKACAARCSHCNAPPLLRLGSKFFFGGGGLQRHVHRPTWATTSSQAPLRITPFFFRKPDLSHR